MSACEKRTSPARGGRSSGRSRRRALVEVADSSTTVVLCHCDVVDLPEAVGAMAALMRAWTTLATYTSRALLAVAEMVGVRPADMAAINSAMTPE